MNHLAPSMKNKMRLLVLNPNSSAEMTHGMEQAIASMGLSDVRKMSSIHFLFTHYTIRA